MRKVGILTKKRGRFTMIEKDTVRLLRECDAGVKMGVSAINDVIDYVSSDALSGYLKNCKNEHLKINAEIQKLLADYGDEGKAPSPFAKGMSKMKTGVKLAVNESDTTIADLMTDGCNMGVKTLNRYLNEYKAADESSKDIAKRLINLEEKMTVDIRGFL